MGKSFAQATRKDEDESDLDLDFLPDEATTEEASGFQSDPANAHLTVGHVAGAVALGQTRPTSLPLSSFGIRQLPDHSPGSNIDSEPGLHNHQASPARHNALSRAFVRTIGRLGRWKRVFQPKSPDLTPRAFGSVTGSNVSAFDLELNASADHLTTESGVYLRKDESPTASLHSSAGLPSMFMASSIHNIASQLPKTPPATFITPTVSEQIQNLPPTPESPLLEPLGITASLSLVRDTELTLPSPPLSPVLNSIPASDTALIQQHEICDISSNMTPPDEAPLFNGNNVAHGIERPESFRSSSTDSFGALLTSDGPLSPTFPGTHAAWQFDVVSIDDLDFSDTSSLPGIQDLPDPPGLRKQRKLPMRREFEFVRRSEVSSMGIISHESLRDSVNSSTPSERSPTSSLGSPQPIQRWQMRSLQQTFEEMSNDDDNKGDVDAALRRLEGQINPKVLQENAEKVDGWLLNLRERMAKGDYANSIYSEDEVEDFFDEVDVASSTSMVDSQTDTAVATESESPTHQLLTPPNADMSPKDIQSRVEEIVPVQSRLSFASIPTNSTTTLPLTPAKLTNGNGSRYQSFILGFSADQLARHFSMIDRELFMSIKFEELVTGEWLEGEEVDILDWAQYLKDRARWKAEARNSNKTTALAAVRARFNLMVSFVNAEVVRTPPNERTFVVSRFIRIAWASFVLQIKKFQC